ncbi:MAG: DUF134 domain-containing protein [Bacillota bacterium]|nr:DUF134 domain-containing protein [Bacillota bacterium]
MPRPPKSRWISFWPAVTYFKPAGVPLRTLEEVVIQLDELEAMRLKDMEGLDQTECAHRMGVSQSTLQRMLTVARAKVTGALVTGKALRIQGGPVAPSELDPVQGVGRSCRGRGRWGRGRGWAEPDSHELEGPAVEPGEAAPERRNP